MPAGYVFILTSKALLEHNHFYIGKARRIGIQPFNLSDDDLYLVNKWYVEDAVECERLLQSMLHSHQIKHNLFCIKNYFTVMQYMRGITLGRKRPLESLIELLLPDVHYNGRYFMLNEQPLSLSNTKHLLHTAIKTTFTELEQRCYNFNRVWRCFQHRVAHSINIISIEDWLNDHTANGDPDDCIVLRNIYARMLNEKLCVNMHSLKMGLRRWAKRKQLPFLREFRAVTHVKLL